MTTTAISQTLTHIFDELPPDHFQFRRTPKFQNGGNGKLKNDANNTNHSDDDNDSGNVENKNKNDDKTTSRDESDCAPCPKRIKTESPKFLNHPEVVRLVSEFLDPLELHTWSCSCNAVGKICTLAVKLDHVFAYFSILKRYTDWIHHEGSNTSNDNDSNEGKDAAGRSANTCTTDGAANGASVIAGGRQNYYWNLVLKIFLQAIRELYNAYGPYKVHPLHAAIVGEVLCLRLARRGKDNLDEKTSFADVWNHNEGLEDSFVLGGVGDYFEDDEGIEYFRKLIEDGRCPEKFPSGPARILAKEGRLPYINIFCREEESHTDQVGFFFPNREQYFPLEGEEGGYNHNNYDEYNAANDLHSSDNIPKNSNSNNNKDEGDDNIIDNDIPAEIFVLNYQELPCDTDEDEECISWYKKLCRYNINNDNDNDNNEDIDDNNNGNQAAAATTTATMTLAKVFCKHIPLYSGEEWDEWTQLLRAGWLNAHSIFPFDDSEEGKMRWDRVIKSIGPLWENDNNNKNNSTSTSNGDNEDPIEHITGTTEVLQFSKYMDREVLQFARSYAMVYLRLNHDLARGSDYVV